MMIYANGKGASRNFDLALKFACEFNGAPEGNQGQINHLLGLREEHWTGDDFNLCDDASSGFMQGACAGLEEEFHQVARACKLGGIVEKWTPAEKTALADLQKAASNFIAASSDNEVDTTGTGRAAFVFEWRTWLGDGFVAALERSEQGQFPSFSAAEFKKADEELNAVYSGIQAAKPQEAEMGTVTPEGVKTAQRAWLKYREAWVKFGLMKYPGVKPEGWRTWLTFDRILMLHHVPGPQPPEWQAFQEFLPWRYHYDLGEALGGDVGEYREAIRLKPDWAPPHNSLGEELAAKGDWEGAIKEYRDAIRLDPNNADARHNLGFAFEKRKDWDGAVKEYREVVRLKPNDAIWHSDLGRALASKKDWDGAIQEYREALRLEPADPGVHGALGWALENKKDVDGAIKEYREAVRLNPGWADAHTNLGWALYTKGDLDAAVTEYHESIRLKPDDSLTHYDLGYALRKKDDLDGGIAEFREVLRLKPDLANTHYDLGMTLEGKGEGQSALEEYRKAQELDPKDPTIRSAYERLLEKSKK